MRWPLLLIVALAVGCGPTRTAGTKGVPADQLAILHVTSTYNIPAVQVAAIGFDDGEKFDVDGERDFYLTPGVHRIALDLKAQINGPMKWLASSFGADKKMEGPAGLATGDLQPGKTYELRGLADTMQGLIESGGEMAITREMVKK